MLTLKVFDLGLADLHSGSEKLLTLKWFSKLCGVDVWAYTEF